MARRYTSEAQKIIQLHRHPRYREALIAATEAARDEMVLCAENYTERYGFLYTGVPREDLRSVVIYVAARRAAAKYFPKPDEMALIGWCAQEAQALALS